jgi:hypothetical protein
VEPVKTDKQRRLRRWRGLRVCGERATADSNGRGVGATRGGAATNGQRQPPSWPHPASLPIARGLHSIPSVHRLSHPHDPTIPSRARATTPPSSEPHSLCAVAAAAAPPPLPHSSTAQGVKATMPSPAAATRFSPRAPRGFYCTGCLVAPSARADVPYDVGGLQQPHVPNARRPGQGAALEPSAFLANGNANWSWNLDALALAPHVNWAVANRRRSMLMAALDCC